MRLAVEATTGVTEVVEAMHRVIAGGPAVLGNPMDLPVRHLAGPIFRAIQGTTRAVGIALDAGLAGAGSLATVTADADVAPGPERLDTLVALLNGVIGDHLAESGNPLALQAQLVHGGRALDVGRDAEVPWPDASRTLLVLVHGCCMSDRRWRRHGHDHGAALARDLGVTPVYARYNSGLHISVNGRALAEQLERLVRAHPAAFDDLLLLGHSMGGLVARSACWHAEAHGHAWRRKVRKLVCLGVPHHGAPLERAGQWLHALLGVSRYSAPLAALGRIRSAGVTDLRSGDLLDAHWAGRDRFALRWEAPQPSPVPLPAGVECYAIAASRSPAGAARPRGDGLVPVDSALGRHRDPACELGFTDARRWILHEAGHFDLLGRPGVYEQLRAWLAS